MARIHDPRPLAGDGPAFVRDELSVRWGAGQPEARPAAPARAHSLPSLPSLRGRGQGARSVVTASGEREPQPESPSRESPTGPDPDAPGEGVVHDDEPAEPNEPG